MTFITVPNVYGDLQILGPLPTDPTVFSQAIDELFADTTHCNRGVWLELPLQPYYPLLSIAIEKGFQVHHSYRNVLTLQAWRKLDPVTGTVAPNPTPPYPSVGVGAGAIVINKNGHILGINEKYDTSNYLFPPGGHVDEGENWVTAAVREAYEETGVRSEPLGIISIRQLQIPRYTNNGDNGNSSNNSKTEASDSSSSFYDKYSFFSLPPWDLPLNASSSSSISSSSSPSNTERARTIQSFRFGTSHLGVHVLCVAIDDTLDPDHDEISDARWYPPEVFIERAHAHIAVMVAAAQEAGQIQEAAEYARVRYEQQQRKNHDKENTNTLSSSLPSSLSYIHTTHAWLATARRGAVADTSSSTHGKRPILHETLHTFYHSYSPSLFARVATSLPRTTKVHQGSLMGTVIPVPESNSAYTRSLSSRSHQLKSVPPWLLFSSGVIMGIGIALSIPLWRPRMMSVK